MDRAPLEVRRSGSFSSIDLQMGADVRCQIQVGPLPSPRLVRAPSVRTTEASLSDFPSEDRSESPPHQSFSGPRKGGSVVSRVSSKFATVSFTSQGYYSSAKNIGHFSSCADSWLKLVPEDSLDTDISVALTLVFETASQLGLYHGNKYRPS